MYSLLKYVQTSNKRLHLKIKSFEMLLFCFRVNSRGSVLAAMMSPLESEDFLMTYRDVPIVIQHPNHQMSLKIRIFFLASSFFNTVIVIKYILIRQYVILLTL